MSIDRSYQVTRYCFECEHCGRQFSSSGRWASDAVRRCEEECSEQAKKGQVRIFLRPPGRQDTMFVDMWWAFVEKDSPRVQCAKEGHDVELYWAPYINARRWDPVKKIGVEIPREIRKARCRRCLWDAREFQEEIRERELCPKCEGYQSIPKDYQSSPKDHGGEFGMVRQCCRACNGTGLAERKSGATC